MGVFSWKGVIQFSLVNVPVKIVSAVKEEGISFNLMHRDCGGAIGYDRAWKCKAGDDCKRPNEPIDDSVDVVKGWNGHQVDLDYIAKLKAEKSSVIEIREFVPASQIDPRYYKQSYDVTPDEGGAKAYALLAATLADQNVVALGKAILRDKEQIVTIRPRDGILALEDMFWPADLTRMGRDLKAKEAVASVEVTEAERQLAAQLVATMRADFDPTKYRDEYGARAFAYLNSLGTGDAPPIAPKEQPKAATNDLMAALQASVAAKVTSDAKPKRARAKKEPVGAK